MGRSTLLCKLGAATLVLIYLLWLVGTWGRAEASRVNTMALDKLPELDFLCFYAASSLALSGKSTAVYDARLFLEEEARISQGNYSGARPFWYPPTYILIVLPLSLIPFLFSLTLWCIISLLGFLIVLKRTCPHSLTIWVALAFPATFQNAVRGQNGFLSVIFMGGGLLLLERSPYIAGLLLGLMTYKPSLAALIPVALLAGRQWRAVGGAITSAVGMALISLVVFGPETWLAYLRQLSVIAARITPDFCFEFNTTVYAAAAHFGSNPRLGKMLHWLVMGIVALAVAWSWSRKGSLANRGSILIIGMLLFPPYLLVYDLTLLALPIAWLAWQGLTTGWSAGEELLLMFGFLLPLLGPLLAAATGVQIAPFILVALVIVVLRRLSRERLDSNFS